MELIRDLHNLKNKNDHCVATIGNFDGVHLGHHSILRQLREKAAQLNLPSTVIIFEPQPQEFFFPEAAPPRVMRFREKIFFMDKEHPLRAPVLLEKFHGVDDFDCGIEALNTYLKKFTKVS